MNDLEKIKKAIKKADLPDYVTDLRYLLDTDSTGDPAVRIWVILDDPYTEEPGFFECTKEIAPIVREAVRNSGVDRWPYVSFRSKSEQDELENEVTHNGV